MPMLKLYKRTATGLRYWEAWTNRGDITIHQGELGSRGTSKTKPIGKASETDAIDAAAKGPLARKYSEIPTSQLIQLVIQARIPHEVGSAEFDLVERLERVSNESLGWTGNGHCDGHDIGSGTINVFCFVVDPELAGTTMKSALDRELLLDRVEIAYSDGEDYIRLHPDSKNSPFKVL